MLQRRKKCQISVFHDVQNGRGGTKYLAPYQRGQKIILNQSKPILVIVSMKPFTRVSGKMIFHAKLSGQFLLRQPLKILYLKCSFDGKYVLNIQGKPGKML